jgi:hypothetical protein
MTESRTGSTGGLLRGRREIAAFITDELGMPVTERQVGHMLETRRIPSGRLGRLVIGHTDAIREQLTRVACGEQAA